MSEIALMFLLANAAAACVIALVLVLRKPVRAAFGARIAYALWLLAPLAAIGSLLPPRIVEIVQSAPSPLNAPPVAFATDTPSTAAPFSSGTPAASAPLTATPAAIDPWLIATLLWLAGAIAMFAWQIRNQSRFMADARAGFAGPAVAGLLRPRIVTPADFEDRFDRDERQVIIAHETLHLRRNDARINALAALARCLCWFNPLVHVAAHLMRIDQELACDAAVIERHPKARAVYASALLKAQLAARPLPLGCYWPAGGDHPLTERIEMLKRAGPGRHRRIVGASALALLALGACAGAWGAKPPETRLVLPASVLPLPPEFDASDPVHIVGRYYGILTKAFFGSRTIQLLVRDEDGTVWAVSTPALSDDYETLVKRMKQRGIEVRAYRAKDKTCNPNCRAYARGIIIPDAQANLAPTFGNLPLPAPPTAAPQPVRYTQQTPAPSATGVGADQPVFVRGKAEKIDFDDARYVIRLRASSTGTDTSSSSRPSFWGENVNTALWTLSPANYFGARDAIEKDLLGREIIVRGDTASGLSCAARCQIKVRELVVPKSTAVPGLGRPFGISDFAMYYDSTQPMLMTGKVQRVEFGDSTFDIWMQTQGYGVDPGVLYQVRSEYFLPRADIEARLRDQSIVASGWSARGDYHGVCSPVCGMYAEMMWLENGTPLRPGSNRQISPPPVASAAQPAPSGDARPEPADLILQPRMSNPPIEITALTGERFPDEGRIVYRGNVQMTQGDARLRADELTVTCLRNAQECEDIGTMTAESNVVYRAPNDVTIWGDHGRYDYPNGVITFTGAVNLKRGDHGIIRAAEVAYSVPDKKVDVSGGRMVTIPAPN